MRQVLNEGLLTLRAQTRTVDIGRQSRQPTIVGMRRRARVRQQSPALAGLTARYLLVESHSSQAAFALANHLAHADPMVERFECWARRRLSAGFSLPLAARATGTSERTLARRLRTVLGKSPLQYFQDIRVEQAVHLLQSRDASVDQIATQVGYADGVSLRTLLRRKIGRGIREIRSRN